MEPLDLAALARDAARLYENEALSIDAKTPVRVMGDRLRPDGNRDPHGVADARSQLRTSYAMIEQQMADGDWAMGGEFGLADCAALPPLFYGNMVEPFGAAHGNVSAYFERLKARASVARVLKEAEPYFNMLPKER